MSDRFTARGMSHVTSKTCTGALVRCVSSCPSRPHTRTQSSVCLSAQTAPSPPWPFLNVCVLLVKCMSNVGGLTAVFTKDTLVWPRRLPGFRDWLPALGSLCCFYGGHRARRHTLHLFHNRCTQSHTLVRETPQGWQAAYWTSRPLCARAHTWWTQRGKGLISANQTRLCGRQISSTTLNSCFRLNNFADCFSQIKKKVVELEC